jgi:tRNA nucleotidyltransferase (CCA-adding enzyme)
LNLHLNDWQATIAASVLCPKTWPFDRQWLPAEACLVGGTVRDALLDRQSDYLDLDFVLPTGAVETARAIARHYKAGFVLLDAERQIARVVFPQGTVDFAQQVGDSLEMDLRRRDFTVNAIAYNPHTEQLLDPLQGYVDLQAGYLRMVSPINLEEDPLRLLRAYRQAAQLGFNLEPRTQQVIRQLAPCLNRIAAERVQSELNYLLNASRGTLWLTAAWEDGLLQSWFPLATAASLAQVAAIDRRVGILQETWIAFSDLLRRNIRHGASDKPEFPKAAGSIRTWIMVAKLASLMPPQPQLAEAQLWRLKYSRAEIQAVSTVVKGLPQLQTLTTELDWSLAEQYFFFQSIGAAFPALALLAIAASIPLGAIAPLMQRFLNPDDPVAHPAPLVTGQDLMMGLNLSAGPRIGQLLAALQLARAEGKIHDRDSALALAQAWLVEEKGEGCFWNAQ